MRRITLSSPNPATGILIRFILHFSTAFASLPNGLDVSRPPFRTLTQQALAYSYNRYAGDGYKKIARYWLGVEWAFVDKYVNK